MRIPSIRALMCALLVLTLSTAASAQGDISVTFGPPALPIYEQSLCPHDGYIWIPGYWAWHSEIDDDYWVPGTWVLTAEVGFLWAPPYGAWDECAFVFHKGYCGPRIDFNEGEVYGFGYFGLGFVGGGWDVGPFFYNRSVTNTNVFNGHNVYNETAINSNVEVNRVSYSGGRGGLNARTRPEDETATHERQVPPVAVQTEHVHVGRAKPELRASTNRGRRSIAATTRPLEFREGAVVPARKAGAPSNPQANSGGKGLSHQAIHPRELPPFERPATPNTGDPDLDRQYLRQWQKLFAKQERERKKLQRLQEHEHRRLDRQNADEVEMQQVEQRHQQQTERLQQRHLQQQRGLEIQQAQPQKQVSVSSVAGLHPQLELALCSGLTSAPPSVGGTCRSPNLHTVNFRWM